MPISRPSTTRAHVPSHWPAAVRSAPGGATAGVFLTVGAEPTEGVGSPYGSFFSSRSTSAISFSQSFSLSTTLVLSCLGPPIRVREDIASSAMQFATVSDDTVVVVALPHGGCRGVPRFVDPLCGGGFERSHDGSQRARYYSHGISDGCGAARSGVEGGSGLVRYT